MNELSSALPIPKPAFNQKFYRSIVFNIFKRINTGRIYLIDHLGEHEFGKIEGELSATLTIKDLNVYRLLVAQGSIGFAKSYINGDIATDNLTNLIRIFAQNLKLVTSSEKNFLNLFFSKIQTIYYLINNNYIQKAKQHILAHYDLSNDFFALFLDPTMCYSAAIFPSPTASLTEASKLKVRTLLDRLQLKPTDHLLEIGCGWGELCITAAKEYGCKVTATTISDQQYIYTLNRIKQENLLDKITLIQADYRELTGKYDKIVSIEMIEAVGYQYYKHYFTQCSKLLTDKGILVLQAITIQDSEYERAKNEVDFIKKFIFPGGCLPSMREISNNIAQHTNLSLVSAQDITYDYVLTLQAWRANFIRNTEKIRSIGFDQQFMRTWDYYFCYCAAGFLERKIMTLQLCYVKPDYYDPRQS